MIWTTTPWTLPANVAIAVHPDLEYAGIRYVDPATNQVVLSIVAAESSAKVMGLRGIRIHRARPLPRQGPRACRVSPSIHRPRQSDCAGRLRQCR